VLSKADVVAGLAYMPLIRYIGLGKVMGGAGPAVKTKWIRLFPGFAVLLLFLTVAGCATTRSEIHVGPSMRLALQSSPEAGKPAFIRSITDERVFHLMSPDPRIPTIGVGGEAGIQARAVGRKRNGYGEAMGDVILQDGTVMSLVRQSIE
jgi:hypothetical protein